MAKRTIVILTCALLMAPLAFSQTRSKRTARTVTTAERVTVTGMIVATEEGSAASYQPAKTLVVRTENSNNSERYVMEGTGRVVDKWGRVIRTPIKPGARVLVNYADTGYTRLVDHVVVLD